jgi:cytochrome o ubiquinol oxidase subunit 2
MIAEKEYDLMMISTYLMLIVVIPVFILTFVFAWKYRASNRKAKYDPTWDFNLLAEAIWWIVPCIIIAALGVLTWRSSHELDPLKPIASEEKPLTIQVISLQWKWLFIYPEEGIATIGFIQFPEKVPLVFDITSDAPMNSFWIPDLGGQIYAMPGMKTALHLIADEQGSFRGSSANLSGRGFAEMTFTAKASSKEAFSQWVEEVKQSGKALTWSDYEELVKPGTFSSPAYYILKEQDLYHKVIMKYMMPHSH